MISPEAVLENLESKVPSSAPSTAPSVPAPPAAVQERAPDYFAWSNMPKKKASEASLDAHEPVRPRAPEAQASVPPTPAAVPTVQRMPSQDVHANPWAAHTPSWEDQRRAVSPKQSSSSIRKEATSDTLVASPEHLPATVSRSPSREQLNMSPRSLGRSLSPKASRSSLASSASYYGQVINVQSGGKEVRVAVEPDNASIASEPRGRSRSRTRIKYVLATPFLHTY